MLLLLVGAARGAGRGRAIRARILAGIREWLLGSFGRAWFVPVAASLGTGAYLLWPNAPRPRPLDVVSGLVAVFSLIGLFGMAGSTGRRSWCRHRPGADRGGRNVGCVGAAGRGAGDRADRHDPLQPGRGDPVVARCREGDHRGARAPRAPGAAAAGAVESRAPQGGQRRRRGRGPGLSARSDGAAPVGDRQRTRAAVQARADARGARGQERARGARAEAGAAGRGRARGRPAGDRVEAAVDHDARHRHRAPRAHEGRDQAQRR